MDQPISRKKYNKLKKSHKRLSKHVLETNEHNFDLASESCDLFVENRQLKQAVSVLSKVVAVGVGVLYLWAKSRRARAIAAQQPQ